MRLACGDWRRWVQISAQKPIEKETEEWEQMAAILARFLNTPAALCQVAIRLVPAANGSSSRNTDCVLVVALFREAFAQLHHRADCQAVETPISEASSVQNH
jgi:hypothetical protein